jgi:hypothetical protein
MGRPKVDKAFRNGRNFYCRRERVVREQIRHSKSTTSKLTRHPEADRTSRYVSDIQKLIKRLNANESPRNGRDIWNWMGCQEADEISKS